MKKKIGIYAQIQIIAFISIIVFLLILLVLYHLRREQEKIVSKSAEEQFSHEVNSLVLLNSAILKQVVYDYTYWDEFVNKLNSKDSMWFEENISSILKSFREDIVMVYDINFIPVYISSDLSVNYSFISESILNKLKESRFLDFFIRTPSGLLEISGATIHPSKDPKHLITKPRGFLFIGKQWGNDYIKLLETQSSSGINISFNSDSVVNSEPGKIIAISTLFGWEGKPLGRAIFNKEDHAYSIYQELSRNILIIIILSIISFWLVFHFFSKKLINRPLKLVTRIFENNDNRLIENLKNAPGEFSKIAVLFENQFRQKEELRIAKEKSEESEKLKSAFLANMSHEIRTPMNGILGFAELLRVSPYSPETQIKYLDIIEKSGRRLIAIINDLIDLSKIESGQMKINFIDTNINKCLNYIYSFFKYECEKKGLFLKVKIALPDEKSMVTTDKEKLYAILINLVKNAIKFTDEGQIQMGYSIIDQGTSQFVKFFVKDTGIGIDKEKHATIFDRFVQVDSQLKGNYEGSGLGLAITKAYTQMLGGEIWLESEPGTGTEFFFTIPFTGDYIITEETSVVQPEIEPIKIDKYGKALKILVAEDDEISIRLMKKVLKDISPDVTVKKNSKEILEFYYNTIDIDLILLDILLPGIDGLEITRKIREKDKKIVIIAQTAFALDNDKQKALDAGCNDYIAKPISKANLVNAIHKYFNL